MTHIWTHLELFADSEPTCGQRDADVTCVRLAECVEQIEVELARSAGVVSLRRLAAEGVPRAQAARQVRALGLVAVRPGWYAREGADTRLLRAVRLKGALTCVDALAMSGVWRPPSARGLHLRLPDRSPEQRDVAGHRLPGRVPVLDAVDIPALAAACVIRCQPTIDAVATLDSALRLGILGADELDELLAAAGPRGARLRRRIDPSAESGPESMLRQMLVSRRLPFVPQMRFHGVGRVDFLIGDRLIVEVDSQAWHSKPADVQRDLARTNRLRRFGFDVLRFSYFDVVDHPEQVMATILGVVRRGEHRWSRRNCPWRRDGLPDPVLGPFVHPAAQAWGACVGRPAADERWAA